MTPHDQGGTLPVMLSSGMPAEEIMGHYGEDLGLRTNEGKGN